MALRPLSRVEWRACFEQAPARLRARGQTCATAADLCALLTALASEGGGASIAPGPSTPQPARPKSFADYCVRFELPPRWRDAASLDAAARAV